MSPFAGFMMPIQYSSITAEHNAVRGKSGLFDVSHMGEVFVSGPDAEKYVNHIFTNDVRVLAAGQILYGMMLYPDGGNGRRPSGLQGVRARPLSAGNQRLQH